MSCKSDWRWEAKCSSPDCCKGGRKRRRKSRRKRRRTRRKQRKHGGNGLKIIEKYKRTPAAAGNPTKRLPQGLRAPRWRPGELASHTLISPNTTRTTIRRSRRPPVSRNGKFGPASKPPNLRSLPGSMLLAAEDDELTANVYIMSHQISEISVQGFQQIYLGH